MIQIYCGDGKGKTTAAVGLAVRAAGGGLRVLFLQFLKGRTTGECDVLRDIPGIETRRAGASEKFTFQMTADERKAVREDNDRALETVRRKAGGYDLLVLDEALGAVERDLLDEALLRRLLEEQGAQREIVLTGRVPEPWMLEMADYVTDMEKIKHPFDRGIEARKGIEY